MRSLANGKFGAFIIRSVEEGGRTCANGLPLVPPNVRMLGRFQHMKALRHENLCQYLDLFRCSLAKNLVIIVSEHHLSNLQQLCKNTNLTSLEVIDLSLQIAKGLEYLHEQGYVHGNLDISNIEVFQIKPIKIRLASYALSYLTDFGEDSESLIINSPYCSAPEILLSGSCSEKSDVWSFGMVVQQMYTKTLFSDYWSGPQFISIIEKCCKTIENANQCLFNTLQKTTDYEKNDTLEKIIMNCINALPSKRPTITEILKDLNLNDSEIEDFEYVDINALREEIQERMNTEKCFILSEMPIEDAFFLWKMSGASCESIMIRKGVIQLRAPVSTVPSSVIEDFVFFGNEESRQFQFDDCLVILPDDKLLEKISSLKITDVIRPIYFARITDSTEDIIIDRKTSSLTVVIKEKDVKYQAQRMSILRHLVDCIQFDGMEELLRKEAFVDIPPVLRSRVWRSLLHVEDEDCLDFYNLDTLAPHTSDRQLDVDIPRCHQYEDMMTSPAAHSSLRRILKAWLLSNTNYVYWQGCDSLAAPFLLLNFNDPQIALPCLNEFINRYLFNFFLRDNSAIIQEYLAVFNHLLAYVDAQLYTHLADLGFFPELYAIPWFLTCFAHVLPMHKLYHVWDYVLLHDTSFPLMVGLAVMKQLRPRLIDSSFNDAILLFSDLPDLPIDKLIENAVYYYKTIPPSCTFRVHDSPWKATYSDAPYNLNREISPFTVAELKELNCPRMSKDEFCWRVHQQSIVVIDIRSSMDFNRGCVIRSIHYGNIEDDTFKNVMNAFKIAQENCHPICVVWGKDFAAAVRFSGKLVFKSINGVCILDGGFENIRDDRSLITIGHFKIIEL
ncbi:unnamed protein product [Caenorhabditis angaria]|uniref:TBC domain-containing protein kinase-like protein n=1 Tax=Caenorhabditis angaria TaxID=860376 RepID=A0A9P1J0I6_9PELO|nr:unnamed protein product [Caenorhabditis angaria]